MDAETLRSCFEDWWAEHAYWSEPKELAWLAFESGAAAAPESDLASLKDLACQFHEWAKTSERVGGQEECAVALEKWIAEREPGGEPTR
jgi:hypothetical protein